VGGALSKLFPEDVKREAARRYEQIQSQRDQYEGIGKAWLGCVIASLLILILFSLKNLKGLIFWIPTVVILGPLGLIIWLIAGHKRNPAKWQLILIESVGDVAPSAVAFVLVAVGIVLSMGFSDLVSLLLFMVSPILIAWLIFQSLLLSFATGKGYWQLLLQRMPHTWVAANLGMAGVIAVATPLFNQSLQLPLPLWTVFSWCAFTGLGALVGMLLLFLYHTWGMKRGYQAWSIFSVREGEVSSPSWRKGWWWILLSYVILFGGIVTFIVVQQSLTQ
jgi:hypothetical protein